jgi:cyanophycinase
MLTEKASMNGKVRGSLIIVGGHEEKEKEAERAILEEIAVRAKRRKGSLVVMTVATQLPEEVASEYRSVFRDLGVRDLDVVDIRSRDDAHADDAVEKIRDASVVYFTGGDQLRITSQVGDSPVFRCLNEIYRRGATIAGTSAGAAAMSETMLVSGAGDESAEISALGMAPGLGLLSGVVVDSHFAERGRFGRLLGAVAQNPKNIGLGIDEDTAVVVEREERFRVVGSGAVYVVDGTGVSYSSLSERRAEGILSIFDVKVHVLGDGDTYDLVHRRPAIPEEREDAAS